MNNYYINGIGCVSAQDTSNLELNFDDFKELKNNKVEVFKPNYRAFIKPAMIRRMSSGVKSGIVASSMALKEANIDLPEAIITGSGMGCLRDSEKFLEGIINNNEQYLTPTSFIQSTHNTVGGQIALGLSCKSYNVTYVHQATSFESSLIDSMMMIDEGSDHILIGGVDEIGPHTTENHELVGHVKKESDLKNGILNSDSKGSVFSEGAQFFAIEREKKNSTYAKFIDVAVYDKLEIDEVENKMNQFLNDNKMQISDIDMIVLGINGDIDYDEYYNLLMRKTFKNTQQVYYKHLSGEYNTASAFGLWAACKIIKDQSIPKILKINNKEVPTINNVLLYNQYRGLSHSFTLLSSC